MICMYVYIYIYIICHNDNNDNGNNNNNSYYHYSNSSSSSSSSMGGPVFKLVLPSPKKLMAFTSSRLSTTFGASGLQNGA